MYSSRSRGTWSRRLYLVRLAPEGWKEQHGSQSNPQLGESHEEEPHQCVSAKEARSAWPKWSRSDHPSLRSAKRTAGARLIAKVYEVDALRCPRCGSKMKVKAVITDPQQLRRILRHLIKTGAAPPDVDLVSVS